MKEKIVRKNYLNKLIKFKDTDVIKIVTGIRRCGKSVLLSQYIDYLKSIGIKDENIIFINFEFLEYDSLKNYDVLYKYIKNKTINGKMYLLIDEIQEVDHFEKAIDSLFASGHYDIYLTGSNSRLLSRKISTLLSGRYVEIPILPFSFKEYLEITNLDKNEAFKNYVLYGGLPYATQINDIETKLSYIEGIYNTVVLKDIIERKGITDSKLLNDILKCILDTVGNTISSKKIADTLTSKGKKTSYNTVNNYLNALKEAFIIYEVERYDIRGKQRLNSLEKYYVVDLGFRTYVLNNIQSNYGSVLENIVYLELIRRGYHVNIGKIDNLEIDFIATKNNEKIYLQVSSSVIDENTFKREIAPFLKVKDNYTKIILSLDYLPNDYRGIKIINLIDWLLKY